MKHLIKSTLLAVFACTLAACGGGGDDNGTPTGNVTISGAITFDRVPFKTTLGQGLDFANVIEAPARHVVVEALDASNSSILASTTTDTSGLYSLQVPAGRSVIVRAKAQMLKTGTAPTWNFRVLNNTNGDALYTLDGTAFTTNGNVTRNLRATSGWGGTSYTDTRAAAPFAILDTIYQVKSLILTAKGDAAFPALNLFWSTQNRPSATLCPDTGDVISSLYISFGTNETDDCSTPTPGVSGIYVLGNFQIGDTDEFDQHVIAHEAGHYFEDKFSRSDSIGGSHSFGNRLDLRVAFGEGWGNAFGAMALNDPVYRDSSGGGASDFSINLESGAVQNPGWYSELAISHLLWDFFDPANANEAADTVALGFTPIYNAMTAQQPSTTALTSIFSFSRALKAANPANQAGINALLTEQLIVGAGIDDFGSTETNAAGSANVLPVYAPITLNGPAVQVCGITTFGTLNKLSNRRLLKLDLAQQALVNVTVSIVPDAETRTADPDIEIWRAGEVVGSGLSTSPTESVNQSLTAGTYVIAVYECSHAFDNAYCLNSASSIPAPRGTTCMTVTATGS